MSNEDTIAGTVEELLEKFKLAPQTFNWDVMIAYDRKMTNLVLLQEYMARQSKDTLPPPVDVELTRGALVVIKDLIIGYQFQPLELSFEDAIITKSAATLTMRVHDGTRIRMEEDFGEWLIVSIGSHSPLTGPPFTSKIDLMESPGTVTQAGTVYLSIDEGQFPQIADADDAHTNKLLGDKIQKEFAKWPKAKKEFELSRITVNADDFIRPKNFVMRTHTTEEGRSVDSAKFGDGEVIIYLTTEGGKNGTTPVTNEDQPYLIAGDYTATYVLGNMFLVREIFTRGCEAVITAGNYKIDVVVPQDGFVEKIIVTNGERIIALPGDVTDLPNFSRLYMPRISFGLGKKDVSIEPGDSTFHVEFPEGRLKVVWTGNKEQVINLTTRAGNITHQGNIGVHWVVSRFASFKLLESGDLEMVVDPTAGETLLRVTPRDFVELPEVSWYFREVADHIMTIVKRELEAGIAAFMAPSKYINQFVLKNILFRGEDPVELHRAYSPGDYVTFGYLGKNVSGFTVTPQRTFVALDSAVQFSADPPYDDIVWSVENIDEEGTDIGTIDPRTGLYRSPKTISTRHMRVRVSATRGTTVVHALIGVLSFFIDVTPGLQVVEAGSSFGRQMRAGALDGQVLEWKIVDPSSGARIVKSEEEHGDHAYFPGFKDTPRIFSVDEISIRTTQAPFTEVIAHVVVLHREIPEKLVIVDDPTLPDNQFRVEIVMQDPEHPPKPENYTWEVLVGNGTVDATGLVTADPDSPLPYVVVTTKSNVVAPYMGAGCALFPWPKMKPAEILALTRK